MDIIGADARTINDRPGAREAEASLSVFCEELAPDGKAIRRLQRQMDRQRRAANPDLEKQAICVEFTAVLSLPIFSLLVYPFSCRVVRLRCMVSLR
jgi:hypothetical protein